jgi:hypothetical protein
VCAIGGPEPVVGAAKQVVVLQPASATTHRGLDHGDHGGSASFGYISVPPPRNSAIGARMPIRSSIKVILLIHEAYK